MGEATRKLLVFLAVALPISVLVFLVASDFFTAWSGRAVSTRPPRSEAPASYSVLISNDDGSRIEREWPSDLVGRLRLPVDAMAIPPLPIPDDRPRTSKSRFALHFLVQEPETADFTTVPTTSPRAAGLALIVLLVSLGVRNMVVAGSPFSIEPREAYLPPAQPAAGQVTNKTYSRGRKGPPPPRPRKGRGRR
jgi:hypothetical protein